MSFPVVVSYKLEGVATHSQKVRMCNVFFKKMIFNFFEKIFEDDVQKKKIYVFMS